MSDEQPNGLLVEGDGEQELADGGAIDEYDLTASPNDFNVMTINSFIESGSIQIPGFQRNYVWDIKKASKLIESLILGLPVPQLFLYEAARNKFLVIDGQQRMMSIYYFIKKRFPRKEKRSELRKIFAENERIPEKILEDDAYFQPFKLSLPNRSDDTKSIFHGMNYATLGDYKPQFDLRPIRNIVVKQNSPKDDDSSVYEIFNRLNSGGVNLRPQEIRGCLYHSAFYEMIAQLNYSEKWRRIIRQDNPDLHMKDAELLLRCFAMADEYRGYKPSLAKFLNGYSKKARNFKTADIRRKQEKIEGFFDKIANDVDLDVFVSDGSRRFNIFLLESVYAVYCNEGIDLQRIETKSLDEVIHDDDFRKACLAGTTNTANVIQRFDVTRLHLVGE